MKSVDRKLIESLAQDLMLELNEEEIKDMLEEKETFLEMLSYLNKIDTSGVEAMHYPFEEPVSFLREDTVNHWVKREDALLNAPHHNEEYIEVVKVIK